MSEKLMVLLQRIQPKTESVQPMTEEEMEAQDARVQPLVQRLENRSYKEEMLENTKQTIKGLRSDIRFIGHVLNCNECIMEASIDVERYWGGHGGMAWLDLNNNLEDLVEYNRYDAFEDFENPVDEEILRLWKEIPRVAAYRIGSYWSGTSPDTIRFIKDRLMWAEKLVRIELKKAKRYLRQLKMWNLNGPPPPEYWRTI